ncbi:MAG: phosphotransferase [Bacilli bacterium]|nr:phosphotransferase [Bacilli bacterium]
MIDYKKLKHTINKEYLIDVLKIEKNLESTQGNVYMVYTKNNKYVLKIYDDLNHTKSMTKLHNDLCSKFNIPGVIKNKDDKLYINFNSKYLVLYSFLDGIQIGKIGLNNELVKKIAKELRRLHDSTKVNSYNLNNVPFNDYKLKRKSLLHFDLTKGNIFYNENKIGFIDFDDAKYGSSVCDIAILISLLFFSKKRGVDIDNMNLFIDAYYNSDTKLKKEEIKYIKEIAIKWINHTLENNDINPSTNESFKIKKKLIEEYL